MNVQEFSALKVGDRIENVLPGLLSYGVITDVTPSGVHVRWGDDVPDAHKFFYSVQTTAWFHWTKVEK